MNNPLTHWLLVKKLIFPLGVVFIVWKEIHESIYMIFFFVIFEIFGSFSQMLFQIEVDLTKK